MLGDVNPAFQPDAWAAERRRFRRTAGRPAPHRPWPGRLAGHRRRQRADAAGSDAPPGAGRPHHRSRRALRPQRQLIGEGGLGQVTAWDPLLSRTLAIKTLHLGSEDEQRRALDALILDEGRVPRPSLSRLNIVTVYDAGLSEMGVLHRDGHLAGGDLRQLMDDGWRPDPMRAAKGDAPCGRGAVVCPMDAASSTATSKPANIFMTDRRKPRCSTSASPGAHRGTSSLDGLVTGSPLYLAPEQAARRDPGRAPMYAMGVVLYEAAHRPQALLPDATSTRSCRRCRGAIRCCRRANLPRRAARPQRDCRARHGGRSRAALHNAREMAVALRAWQIRATAPMRLTPAFDPSRQPHEQASRRPLATAACPPPRPAGWPCWAWPWPVPCSGNCAERLGDGPHAVGCAGRDRTCGTASARRRWAMIARP